MAERLLSHWEGSLIPVREKARSVAKHTGAAKAVAQPGDVENRGEATINVAAPRATAGRRRWTAEEKVAIVLESFQSSAPNIETCRRHGISEPTLYKWRQMFVDGGEHFLGGRGKLKLSDLLAENDLLRQALAELALVNRRLRTRHVNSESQSSRVVTDIFRTSGLGRAVAGKPLVEKS